TLGASRRRAGRAALLSAQARVRVRALSSCRATAIGRARLGVVALTDVRAFRCRFATTGFVAGFSAGAQFVFGNRHAGSARALIGRASDLVVALGVVATGRTGAATTLLPDAFGGVRATGVDAIVVRA